MDVASGSYRGRCKHGRFLGEAPCIQCIQESIGAAPDFVPTGYVPRPVTKTAANDKQTGGAHYKKLAIEPWDYIAANRLGYFEGCVVKYVSRWKDKGGLQDLEKARHFLDKLIETQAK